MMTVKTAQQTLSTTQAATSFVAQVIATAAVMNVKLVVVPSVSDLVVARPTLVATVISAITPTSWRVDNGYHTVLAGSKATVSVSDAFGLQLAAGYDAAKVVEGNGTCTDPAAYGTSEASDLGPSNEAGASSASFEIVFKSVGDYKLCYKLAGQTYAMVGTEMLHVLAVPPTVITYDGYVEVGTVEVFTLSGGAGLQIGQHMDTAKAITATGSCMRDGPAGGTSEVTNLGPISNGTTVAIAQFSWRTSGSYQLCYKVLSGNYTSVGEPIAVKSAIKVLNFTKTALEVRVDLAKEEAQV